MMVEQVTCRLPVRVYYEDTDFSGNVYHGAYVRFCERGRTEWLRELGMSHSRLSDDGLVFAVHEMSIRFEAPAHIDDELLVVTAIAFVKGARIQLEQEIYCGDRMLVGAKVTIVVMNARGRAVRLPKELLALLERN